ncbi:MAG TPA: cytochrome c [Flavisolibacter sp.]|nr:cytochrome c [Flavisolibacter sp.]
MKKIIIAASIFSMSLGLLSCGGAQGEDPGRAYMPDMYYARAYEAYGYNMVDGEYDSLASRGIRYNGLTVPGTVARGEVLPYHLTNDSAGLRKADGLRNPIDSLQANRTFLREGERLYQINCGICHGTALDGNGPLYKGGEGPYPAKPQVLNDANAAAWTDGHYYHVITFGKGAMGSYASQLDPEQRWMVINYIRSKQGGGKATADTTTGGNPAAAEQGGSVTM